MQDVCIDARLCVLLTVGIGLNLRFEFRSRSLRLQREESRIEVLEPVRGRQEPGVIGTALVVACCLYVCVRLVPNTDLRLAVFRRSGAQPRQ